MPPLPLDQLLIEAAFVNVPVAETFDTHLNKQCDAEMSVARQMMWSKLVQPLNICL